jgi:hypothetical protein
MQLLEDEHVRRSADGMIAAYGGEAGRICEHQIEKMRRRKDAAGERLWQDVLEQIRRARS